MVNSEDEWIIYKDLLFSRKGNAYELVGKYLFTNYWAIPLNNCTPPLSRISGILQDTSKVDVEFFRGTPIIVMEFFKGTPIIVMEFFRALVKLVWNFSGVCLSLQWNFLG